MRTLDFQMGYVMGLIVGEGSFSGDKLQPCVIVKLTEDRRPLEILHSVFGGNLFGPYQMKPPRRPVDSWQLRGKPLRAAIALFEAHLPASRKRDQYEAWKVRWSGWLDSEGGQLRRLPDGTVKRYEGPGTYEGKKMRRRKRTPSEMGKGPKKRARPQLNMFPPEHISFKKCVMPEGQSVAVSDEP